MITKSVRDLEFLSSPLLSVPHGFSTRSGGVSEGHLTSLNLGHHRGDAPENLRENYRRFCAATGVSYKNMVMTNQVHGDVIRAVTYADVKRDLLDPVNYEADGLTCDIPGVTLTIFTADCVPILFHDPVRQVVAACHAGWRGTALQIGAKTVTAMEARYGCRREDIRAAIGPSIGTCCFETDGDVPGEMLKALGDKALPYVDPQPSYEALAGGYGSLAGRFHVDLKGLNRMILLEAGLLPAHLDLSGACTCCEHERFWSHRYTKGHRGSLAAVIGLEGRP